MAKTNSLNFKINNNTLFINDDRFDLNELLIGEIVRVEDYNENYSIKLTLKDDFVDKWAILVDYNTNDKTEILYNFKSPSVQSFQHTWSRTDGAGTPPGRKAAGTAGS